jgi:hypothetical protein
MSCPLIYDRAVSIRLNGLLMAVLFRFKSLYRMSVFQNMVPFDLVPSKIGGDTPSKPLVVMAVALFCWTVVALVVMCTSGKSSGSLYISVGGLVI